MSGEKRRISDCDSVWDSLPDNEVKRAKEEVDATIKMVEKERKFTGFTAQLAIRIKDYLEFNKNKKYIDQEDLFRTLYDKYPEYGRKKFKSFKMSAEKTFQNLHLELQPTKKKEPTPVKKAVELDVTTVRKSVNSSILDLYAKSPKPVAKPEDIVVLKDDDESVNKSSKKKKKKPKLKSLADDYDIDSDDSEANALICAKEGALDSSDTEIEPIDDFARFKLDAKKAEVVIEEEPLSEFEKIKQKARRAKEAMASAEKKPKKSRPSESLKSHLNKRLSVDIENVNSLTTNTQDLDKNLVNQNGSSGEKGKSGLTNGTSQNKQGGSEPIEIMDVDSGDSIEVNKVVRKTPANTPVKTPSNLEKRRGATSSRKRSSDSIENQNDSRSTPGRKIKKKQEGKDKENKTTDIMRTKFEIEIQESNTSFDDFGGNEALLCDICKLLAHMKHPEIYEELGVSPPQGFLLHGPPGCGKTLLAHAIVGELDLPFLKISAPELVSGVSGDSESKIRDLFTQAIDNAPCVMFIDEIDCITPKRENAQREMERRIVSQLLTCLDELGKSEKQVIVIGATNRVDSLDPALRRAGRFDREIGLGIPDRKARLKILKVLCRGLRCSEEVSLQEIAVLTPGYVGADLSSLVREAAIAAVNRVFQNIQGTTDQNLEQLLEWLKDTSPLPEEELEGLCTQPSDWHAALKVVQPSAKREGFATVPGVSWQDVGALTNIREELQLSILAPVRFQEEFESLGLPASSGVLLAGPPGCGKTLVAKAIANEAGINFISVKGPELLNMYVGESERAVRACFARARNSAPCVIFFDEIDSLCPRRTSNSTDGGSSSRVVNQLLTEMDGVQARNGVFLMAATNRPDILDPAVLRPGRLDKVLYVGFPEPRDRCEILKALTKNGTKPNLGADVNLDTLGLDSRCSGYTGADMSALVREASMAALKARLKLSNKDAPKISVNQEHFEEALNKVRPSVDASDQKKFKIMEKKYTNQNQAKPVTDSTEEVNAYAAAFADPFDLNVNQISRKELHKSISEPLHSNPNEALTCTEDMEVNELDVLIDSSAKDEAKKPSDKSVEKSKVAAEKSGKIYSKDVESTNEMVEDGISVDQAFKQNATEEEEEIVMEGLDDSTSLNGDTMKDDLICDTDNDHNVEVDKSEPAVKETAIIIADEDAGLDKAFSQTELDDSLEKAEVNNDKSTKNGLKDSLKEERNDKSKEKVTEGDTIEIASEDAKNPISPRKAESKKDVENSIINFLNNSQNDDSNDDSNEATGSYDVTVQNADGNDTSVNNASVNDTSVNNASVNDVAEESNDKKAVGTTKRTFSVDSELGLSAVELGNLRFLPDMIIRVVDSSKVPSAAGKTGTIKSLRKNAKVTVILKGLSQRIVNANELEPFMPEEGDKVKLLIPNSTEAIGEVLSMNDQDVCQVKMEKGEVQQIIIDNLCKISTGSTK